MSVLIEHLLEKRGIVSAADIERFLAPDFSRDTHHYSLIQDMERAVARILAAILHSERIAIYADFDCDGIPGAALLYDLFRKIGYDNIEVYIPHRDTEGYGVHPAALKVLSERGVGLIITVDVGTTAVEPVRYAKELGMDVIVTDHHELQDVLPECIVINPKCGEYPFRDLCGSGVAWKLATALIAGGRERGIEAFTAIPEGWEKWLLDFVAIATVADLVPLIGENRVLTHFGLTVLRKSPRPGIRALCQATRLRQPEITEDDISFTFAPRLNAASRMGDPETAFKLLTTTDMNEAESLARHLEELNAKRKGAVASMVREARKRVRARYGEEASVVVLGDTAWKPGLLGLLANTLMGERGGLVCVWGENANGELKGSCRSDGSISVVDVLAAAGDALIEYGGHQQSGGFSLTREQALTLPEALERAATTLEARAVAPSNTFDAELGLRELSWALYMDLTRLAPFGMGNAKPVFRIPRASIVSVRSFGKEKNHTEVELACFDSGAKVRGFDFFRTPDDFTRAPESGAVIDVFATISRDTFRGQRALALRVIDIVECR